MKAPLTRDQIMRGKNLDPDSRLSRAKKGAAASPWSKGHCVHSNKPREGFVERPRPNTGGNTHE